MTGAGSFLRRTSLDELPQLFNVLASTMSLVGPRPDQVDQARFYSSAEWCRTFVKPGITGLAQINGRNSISGPIANNWTLSMLPTSRCRSISKFCGIQFPTYSEVDAYVEEQRLAGRQGLEPR